MARFQVNGIVVDTEMSKKFWKESAKSASLSGLWKSSKDHYFVIKLGVSSIWEVTAVDEQSAAIWLLEHFQELPEDLSMFKGLLE